MSKNSIGPEKLELTLDQNQALKIFKDWLKEKHTGKPFVLSGYAGSGKTFLSMRFLLLAEAQGLCWTVVAPTHKAVGVLNNALGNEGLRPTWYPSTIHRLLRLKLKRKGDSEICEETEQTATSLEQLGLVLVDEASMIDSELLRITLQCAHSFNTRLVFVGDPAQLPPIGEVESSVFSMQRSVLAELHQVVRHQGPVLQLANCLRDGRLPCKSPPCIPEIQTPLGVVGCLDESSWLGRAKSALKSASIKDNPDSVRILCYTNRTLENLVPHVRRAIHGEMADQLPVLPGEVLISRMAVMAPASSEGAQVGEEPDMVLGSNRELVVLDVKPESCDLGDFGLSNELGLNARIINTLSVKIQTGDLELNLRLLPPVGSQDRGLLDSILQKLRIQAKAAGITNGRPLWRRFFLIRDAFASLGPASVLTVHRSQGSSFGEVFVSSDVFWPKDPMLRRQLVYVAVSRARQSVWLLGNNYKGASVKTFWEEVFNLDLN